MFVCPYYVLADNGLYGSMPGIADADTSYYNNLTLITAAMATAAQDDFIAALDALPVTPATAWVNTYLANNPSIVAGGSLDGKYYQLTSQFPGKGPCYPVYIETASFFNRCVPSFPANFTDQVSKFVDGALSVLGETARDSFREAWQSLGQRFQRYTAGEGWVCFETVLPLIKQAYQFSLVGR